MRGLEVSSNPFVRTHLVDRGESLRKPPQHDGVEDELQARREQETVAGAYDEGENGVGSHDDACSEDSKPSTLMDDQGQREEKSDEHPWQRIGWR